VSGLSYVHPHLAQAARRLGTNTATVDLLSDNPCSELPCDSGSPLDLSLRTLQARFEEILTKEGFAAAGLASAALVFEFPLRDDDYYSLCTSTIVNQNGKRYTHKVDAAGNSLEVPKPPPT
jgi:hypothetical protein